LSLARPADLFLNRRDPRDGEASGGSELEASLPSGAATAAGGSHNIYIERQGSVGEWTVFHARTIRRETASAQTLGVFDDAIALGRTARRDDPVVN